MPIFFLLFLVPYGFILCMPGKKSYLFMSALYIYGVIYIFDWLDEKKLELLGPLPYLCICMGAIWGIVTAGIVLIMKRNSVLLNWVMLVRLLMPLTFPLFIAIGIALSNWDMRAPSSRCNYDWIALRMESSNFTVPGSPITSFKTVRQDKYGKKNVVPGKFRFRFWRNKEIRKYCNRSDQGNTPLAVDYISLDFQVSLTSQYRERHIQLCSDARLADSICNLGQYRIEIPLTFPKTLKLFSETEFRIYNPEIDFFKKISNWSEDASAVSGRTDLLYHENLKSYYLLTEDALGTPVAFRCRDTLDNLAYCASKEEIDEDVYLEYLFNLKPTILTEDALRGRENALKFIEGLRVEKEQ